ncbi:MAG: bifunctional DNA primase/polymerase [Cognaticolwellia aestuarii]
MNILDFAIAMAARGCSVFPLVANEKYPAVKSWKNESTTEVEVIEKLFSDGLYNVGLPTGSTSNIIVIDIDIKGGKNGLTALAEKFGDDFVPSEDVFMQQTPTGGLHIFVDWTGKEPLKNGVNVLGMEGVDIRGEGGFVVGAGSTLIIDGEEVAYRVKEIEAPFAEVTGWIEALLTEYQQDKPQNTFDPTKAMEGIDIGERNDVLFRYFCHLKSRGFDIGLVTGFGKHAASLCKPPLPEEEVEQIIANAFAYEPKFRKPTKVVKTLEELL